MEVKKMLLPICLIYPIAVCGLIVLLIRALGFEKNGMWNFPSKKEK
jgi:hypothetical protein